MRRERIVLMIAVCLTLFLVAGCSHNSDSSLSESESSTTETPQIEENTNDNAVSDVDEKIADKVLFSINGEIVDDGYKYTVLASNQSEYDIVGFTFDITLKDENGNSADKKHFDYDKTFTAGSEAAFPFVSSVMVNDYSVDWGYSSVVSADASDSTDTPNSDVEDNSVDIANMSDKEIYDLAVEYYNSGIYSKANLLFNEISEYEDSASYVSNCEIMLEYEGVYKYSLLKDGEYYVIYGNTLSKFDFRNESEGKATADIDTMILSEYEGQPCLINALYADNLEYSMITYYVLTTDENNQKCIEVIHAFDKKNPSYYVATSKYTKEQLIERTQKSQNMTAPLIGMTADEVLASTWGEPEKINRTTTAYGVSEQWVYSGNRYVYLDDGIVTAIQE